MGNLTDGFQHSKRMMELTRPELEERIRSFDVVTEVVHTSTVKRKFNLPENHNLGDDDLRDLLYTLDQAGRNGEVIPSTIDAYIPVSEGTAEDDADNTEDAEDAEDDFEDDESEDESEDESDE